MEHRDAFLLILAAAWGLLIGFFYFWGLWWTLKVIPGKTRPALWLAVSFAVRSLTALICFWLVIRENLTAFFFTFGGFFLMRLVLTRKLGPWKRGQRHAN